MPDAPDAPGVPARLLLVGGEECLDCHTPGITGIAMVYLQVNMQGMFCPGCTGMIYLGEDGGHYRQLEVGRPLVEIFQQCPQGSVGYAALCNQPGNRRVIIIGSKVGHMVSEIGLVFCRGIQEQGKHLPVQLSAILGGEGLCNGFRRPGKFRKRGKQTRIVVIFLMRRRKPGGFQLDAPRACRHRGFRMMGRRKPGGFQLDALRACRHHGFRGSLKLSFNRNLERGCVVCREPDGNEKDHQASGRPQQYFSTVFQNG